MEASEGKGSLRRRRRLFLFLNCIMMCIGGNGGGPLLSDSTSSAAATEYGSPLGFPPPDSPSFSSHSPQLTTPVAAAAQQQQQQASFFTITQNIIFATAALGVLLGRINYVYTYGVAKLPVSTSSLIVASQLAFTADAAFVLVKHRFTVNAVVLLTIGAEVLVVGSSEDRPAGESKKEYVAEFLMALAAASNDLTL